MVTIENQADSIAFEVHGLHKLLALKSQLTIPAENITRIYPN
jgi:hypothetical protein